MSQDIKGIVNLDYIVNLVLMDLDDYSMVKYKKFLQYAVLGYQDLNLYTMQNIKVAYLTVKDNKTADLPNDYIEYTKIGFNSGGSFSVLGSNDDLILPRLNDDCGDEINENSGECDSGGVIGYYFSPHYRNGQYVGEMYGGAGDGNTNGDYRIDRDRWQIAFGSEMSAKTIILEYKSSGVNGNGSTNIPRQCVEALRSYVHWQRKRHNDKVPRNEKIALQQEYYIEFEKLRDLEFSFTYSEYFDSRRSTYSSIPKR